MEKLCWNCKHFEYEESWDGEEECGFYICNKGNSDIVGWGVELCKDFEEAKEWTDEEESAKVSWMQAR